MAQTYKVLGQANPLAATLTALYTVPASTSVVTSSISVCNTAATSATFRVRIAPAGAADALVHALYQDVTIAGNDTFVATIGATLAATDVIRVQGSTANLVFHAYGLELTP